MPQENVFTSSKLHPKRTPTLETKRLVLRPLRREDAPTIFNRWTSDEAVARYMTWDLHLSIEDTEAWLKWEESALDDPSVYSFGISLRDTKELIGSGGLVYDKDEDSFRLGYCLMKEEWGKGFATEAAQAIVAFAINELQVKELNSCHDIENLASGRVLQKVGFIPCGCGEAKSLSGLRSFACKKYLYRTTDS